MIEREAINRLVTNLLGVETLQRNPERVFTSDGPSLAMWYDLDVQDKATVARIACGEGWEQHGSDDQFVDGLWVGPPR